MLWLDRARVNCSDGLLSDDVVIEALNPSLVNPSLGVTSFGVPSFVDGVTVMDSRVVVPDCPRAYCGVGAGSEMGRGRVSSSTLPPFITDLRDARGLIRWSVCEVSIG